MSIAATIAVAFVAVQHVAFLVLEMFLWATPTGRKVFRMSREQAQSTRVLAANQGLYNGFLAAGLGWSLLAPAGAPIATFFTACVVVAGLFGGMTASRGILFVQAVPGAVALALVLLTSG
jgi:putative membrane protein